MTKKIHYDKLVRDKIPEIIEDAGKEYEVRELHDDEYQDKLKEKLQEEVNEYLESSDKEELADVLEVLQALAQSHNLSIDELENLREQKARKRGAFDKQLLLIESEE